MNIHPTSKAESIAASSIVEVEFVMAETQCPSVKCLYVLRTDSPLRLGMLPGTSQLHARTLFKLVAWGRVHSSFKPLAALSTMPGKFFCPSLDLLGQDRLIWDAGCAQVPRCYGYPENTRRKHHVSARNVPDCLLMDSLLVCLGEVSIDATCE